MAGLDPAIQSKMGGVRGVALDGRLKGGHGVTKWLVARLQARANVGTSGQKTRAFSLTSIGSPVVSRVSVPRSSPFK